MNILELDSYNLDDAVKFNDRLNPRLWDSSEHLHPKVREQLMRIADDFREFLGVPDLDLVDITVSGSNAAYTYTPNSDIDLHLVVNMPEDPVYRELFDAKKFQYNEQHDITIGGADVELYVQNADQPHVSQGVYSLVNNDWIQVPRRIKSVVDDTSTRNKFETVGRQIERAIKSGNLARMTRLAEKIKKMRQTGLENHGEFGPENLAFKMLRKQGLIKELYDARNSAKDKEFSLKEQPKQPFVYGFKKIDEVGLTPDGTNPTTCMIVDDEQPTDEEILKDFIDFCAKELKLEHMPTIKLRKDPQWPVVHKTFGRYINDHHLLEVAWGNRHIMDVLRTVAHELTHKHQHERDGSKMDDTAGETGSPWENEANARAGILMRDYARLHPEYFSIGQAADLAEDELDEGVSKKAAAAALVAALSGQPAAAEGLGSLISLIHGVGSVAMQARNITRAGINAETQQEITNFVRAQGGDAGSQNLSNLYQLQRELKQQEPNSQALPGYTQQAEPTNESASGYIPTKKQAQDPRFSMALTVDIKPGQVGKEANKLKLKTDRQGHPQIANPNGLFEKLALELSQFKRTPVAESVEQLAEVRMAPSNLQQWARSPEAQGIRAGFEAELIFRDTTNDGDSDYEMEPDYDMDERCRTIQQVMDFFSNGEYGGLSDRQQSRLQDDLDESYMNWLDDEMRKAFRDEQEDLIKKVLVDENDWDEDNEIQKQLELLNLSDDEMNAIIEAGEKAPKFTSSKEQILYAEANPLYNRYLDAQKEAEDLLDELVQDSIRAEDKFYDAALEDFRDGFYLDDDSGFFEDTGNRWMSDIASNYDLDWPYMTGGGGNDGSRDWESIGDSLHDTIDMPVKVSSGYHNATRKEGLWIVEPDSSLEPDDREDFGLEIVSPPMPLEQALEKLQEVCDWANDSTEGNAYTNSSTGLHMGVSVPFKGGDVDYLKLILFLGDEYVLKQFGREANTYTKSAMSKFRENIRGGRADPAGAMKLMQSGLIELAHREIQKGVGDGKYTSAHIQKGYIEFRSAGGDWLAEENANPEILQNTMLRYARAMSLAANPSEERREYAKKLYKLVAPEGDSELALFSQFAAGELTAEQLKKRWAEKTIGKEKKMNQRWRLYQKVDGVWEPVPGAEWNGYPESEVKNKVWAKYGREALDTGEYQLVNMGEQDWEVYDVNTGATLEIVKGKSKGEVADAVYDKYVDQGIGFQVRPYVDPATLTPRAKLAKRIAEPKEKGDWDVIYKPTGRVIDNILRVDREQAQKLLAKVAVLHDFENADNLEIRPQDLTKAADNTEPGDWEFYRTETGNVIDRVSNASKMQANAVRADIVRRYGHPDTSVGMRRVDQVQDVEPDVAQNFNQTNNATDRVGSWAIYDVTLGRELSRMDNVPWQQASDRADELERSTGHNMSVRGLSESVDAVSGTGAIARAIAGAKPPSPVPVRRKDPAVKLDIKNKPLDPYAQTYKKPVEEGYGQYTRINDPGIFPDGFLYLSNHAKHDRLPQRGIDMDRVIDLCRQAGNQYPQKLRNLGDIQFVIKAPDDFGVGLVKYQTPDGHYRYLIKTAHNRLRYGPEEPVFRVGAVAENFADGKGPGRPGDSQRHGIPKGATMAELEKAAKAPGRKGQLARWQLNMRRGKKK